MGFFLAYDLPHWQSKLADAFTDLALFHHSSLAGKNGVLKPKSIQELVDEFSKKQGTIDNDIATILEYSNHLQNPGYAGHQVVPPSLPSVFAGMLGNYLNQGMAISDMGQAATAIERAVVLKMLEYFRWNAGEGIMTSGGSLGNLTAMLAARQYRSDMWKHGNEANQVVLVSADAHYSIDRAIRIMGFGEAGIVKMQPNAQRKITEEILVDAIKSANSHGKTIMAVVGSACSTGPGVFDDIAAMARVCNEQNIWFHVDAAHGGMLQLSQKNKHLLQGIENADSVVIDFHKMGFTPALTTLILYKNARNSYLPFKQDASYLWSDGSEESWTQSGLRTVECTKLMMGLKAYANLFWLGEREMVRMMDTLLTVCHQFATNINERKQWELLTFPEANICCFRFKDANEKQHKQALQRLIASGTHYIVSTQVDGEFYLRITVMNVYTELEHLTKMIDTLERYFTEQI